MNIHELRQERGDAFAEMENITLSSEGRTMTAAEVDKFDKFQEKYNRATGALDALGAKPPADLRDLRDQLPDLYGGKPTRDPLTDMRTTAGVPVLRSGQRMSSLPTSDGSPSDPSVNLDTIVRATITGDWSKVPPEERAMSIGTPSAGGFAVPEALSSRIIDRARTAARVLQAGALTVPMTPTRSSWPELSGTLWRLGRWRTRRPPLRT